MFVRFVIALVLGAILGLERELVGKESAGVRTTTSFTPSDPSKRSSQASPTEMSASSASESGQMRQRLVRV